MTKNTAACAVATPPDTLQLAYIGLGIMGQPMARRLLKAGYPLHLWARRPASAAALLNEGAQWAPTVAELAQRAEVLFLNVAATADVEQLLLGPDGVLENARPGLIVIDHSTICPLATRRMAQSLQQREITLLDAPVSGGEQGAIHGTLSLMIGGDATTLERIRPVLAHVGTTLTHVGDVGAGQVAKACNQMLVAQMLVAVGETLLLAEAAGVDPAKVRTALLGGFAYSKILDVHGQRMLEQQFTPGFKAALHRKDMGIVQDLARELGLFVPGCTLATQYINAAVGQGWAEQDSSVIAQIQHALLPKPPQ